jgi:uncharacterized SAM-binding protein YcdF (DUF218 family)
MRPSLKFAAVLGTVLVLVWLALLTLQIVDEAKARATERAEVAIVLGAATYGDLPSPVFEERIKHGIGLYKSKRVRRLLFTGGRGPGAKAAEAMIAKRYAVRRGVPSQVILTETRSKTTHQNLLQARHVMRANALNSALIVSDPLHLKRALRMARDLEIDARASPTLTTRYRSTGAKAGFLLRELYFYNHYLITGH